MHLTWNVSHADLQLDSEHSALMTDVIASLFTDRRALLSDDLPDGGNDYRGWWGDSYRERKIGSRLWLLSREKQLSGVLRRAEEYAIESLNWLTDIKRVKSIAVNATNQRDGVLLLSIIITLLNSDEFKTSFNASLRSV